MVMIPNERAFIPDEIYLERMRLKSFVYGLEDNLVCAAKTMTSRDASICVAELQALAGHAHGSLGVLPPADPSAAVLPHAKALHARRLSRLKRAKRFQEVVDLSAAIIAEHRRFRQAPYTTLLVATAPNTFAYPDDEAWTVIDLDPLTGCVMSVTTKFPPGRDPPPGQANSRLPLST